jgi:hypothetical protein
MPIPEMMLKPVAQVGRQSHVVQLPTPVQCVHALPAPDVLPNDFLMFFQCLAGNVLKMLAN